MLIKSLITLFKQHWQIRGCMCMCDGREGGGGVELPGWFEKMWLVTRDTVEMPSNRQLWHDTKWPTLLRHLTPVLSNLQICLKTSGSFCKFQSTKHSIFQDVSIKITLRCIQLKRKTHTTASGQHSCCDIWAKSSNKISNSSQGKHTIVR